MTTILRVWDLQSLKKIDITFLEGDLAIYV